MNLLHSTANILCARFFGDAYVYGKPLLLGAATGSLPQTIRNLALSTFVAPLVGSALFAVPPIRQAVESMSQKIASSAEKTTQWWVANSVKGAIQESSSSSQKAQKELQDCAMEVLQPFVGSNTADMRAVAKGLSYQFLANTLQKKAYQFLLEKILGAESDSLIDFLYPIVLSSGFALSDILDQSHIGPEKRQQLQGQLASELKAGLRGKSVPQELQGSLDEVANKIAEAVVEHPTTDLIRLESALKEADQSIFSRLLDQILAFFKRICTSSELPSPVNTQIRFQPLTKH